MNRKETMRSFVAPVSVFLCFLVISFIFIGFIINDNSARSVSYLDDATRQRCDAMQSRIEGDLQVLRGVALSMQNMDLGNKQAVTQLLDEINRTNSFERMGLADANGQVEMVDLEGNTHQLDFSEYPFFQQARNGQEGVSPTSLDRATHQSVNYYAVPVSGPDGVRTVLCAANSVTVMTDILSEPVFRNEGYFALIDQVGHIVTPTGQQDGPEMTIGANIFENASISQEEAQRLTNALHEAQSGNFSMRLGGTEQMVNLAPLGINNWFVISIVPDASITDYYNQTSYGIGVMLLLACIIFLMLIQRQLTIMRKNKVELEHIAYTDTVTGVRNYIKFQQDAAALLRESPSHQYAVWSIDIKRFNAINNLFGSATGDEVLRRIAQVLSATTQDGVFCRVSADQFAGITSYEQKSELAAWFDEVYQTLSNRKVIPQNMMHIDLAMGIYFLEDFNVCPPIHDMVNCAAIARQHAKQQSGTKSAFFSAEMDKQLRWETEMEVAGERAIANGEFTFVLQPKVSLQNGYHIIGAEALVRWNHPEYGWISPGEFVPLFEKNGFIVRLDRYVFEQVCRWYSTWTAEGNPPLRIAVNVSRQGLLREDYIEYYTSIKEKYAIRDNVLELEVTESVIMDSPSDFRQTVLALRENGFICSIDDFGSGYSSLNVLKELPINVLKLDAVFFRQSTGDVYGERGKIVVQSFIEMAKKLGIQTVAEGVERVDQVAFLKRVGCDLIQGFIFSKPLQIKDFESLIWRTDCRMALSEA